MSTPPRPSAAATRHPPAAADASTPWLSPGAVAARTRLAARPAAPPSLLERLLRDVAAASQVWVSFDDLTGILDQVPDLRLPIDLLMHSSPLCGAAKGVRASYRDCVNNKRAVNRVIVSRGAGVSGTCHLGLYDVVEPVIVRGRVIATLFAGGVPIEPAEVVVKIQALARRRAIDPAPLLSAVATLPTPTVAQRETLRARLRTVAEVVVRVVEAWGSPVPRERARVTSHVWTPAEPVPIVLQKAIALLRDQFETPIQLATVAAAFDVTPDYLSRLFKRHLGRPFQQYVIELRIDRARRFLEAGLAATEVTHRTGFSDQPHFGRVFKRLVGMTPKQYAQKFGPRAA